MKNLEVLTAANNFNELEVNNYLIYSMLKDSMWIEDT